MGDKHRLADLFTPLFPPHECYLEIFAGGGAPYFLRLQPAPVEVLNEINGDMMTLSESAPKTTFDPWCGQSR